MQALAVDLRLMTDAGGPGLRLTPGRALMARVMAADGTGRGVLNIAGAVIEAELPAAVRAGDELRLLVRAVDAHRVELALPQAGATPAAPHGAPAPAAAPTPAPVAVPLPGGGTVRVDDPDGDGGGGSSRARDPDVHTLALRYEAPALGLLDLRFELDPGALRVSVTAAAGPPVELARGSAEALREALAAQSQVPVALTIAARREPLEVYA